MIALDLVGVDGVVQVAAGPVPGVGDEPSVGLTGQVGGLHRCKGTVPAAIQKAEFGRHDSDAALVRQRCRSCLPSLG